MRLFTFFSPEIKTNLIFKDCFLLYTPVQLKYKHVYIGKTPIKRGYDLVITKDKVRIKDSKVVVCDYEDPGEIERSLEIFESLEDYPFVCHLKDAKICFTDCKAKCQDSCDCTRQPSPLLGLVVSNLQYEQQEYIETHQPPSKPTDLSMTSFLKTKIEELKVEDTNIENIFRRLQAVNKTNNK